MEDRAPHKAGALEGVLLGVLPHEFLSQYFPGENHKIAASKPLAQLAKESVSSGLSDCMFHFVLSTCYQGK